MGFFFFSQLLIGTTRKQLLLVNLVVGIVHVNILLYHSLLTAEKPLILFIKLIKKITQQLYDHKADSVRIIKTISKSIIILMVYLIERIILLWNQASETWI